MAAHGGAYASSCASFASCDLEAGGGDTEMEDSLSFTSPGAAVAGDHEGCVPVSSGDYSLVILDQPKSPIAEAMRVLRTNLQYAGLDGPLRSLLVTSSGPSEGKTSISGNLAASYAMSDVETIVVGVDLRKPALHKVFGTANSVGLTNLLLGRVSLNDALIPTAIPKLRLLPAGPTPPNPAELLGSQAMRDLIKTLETHADLVIFDAPPVLAAADAALLAPLVSGTILVVDMEHTSREMAKRAKEQLAHVKANLLGVVANRVQLSGYYHYYYGEDEAQNTRGMRAAVQNGASGRLLSKLMGGRGSA